jgi:hypothetical protein
MMKISHFVFVSQYNFSKRQIIFYLIKNNSSLQELNENSHKMSK